VVAGDHVYLLGSFGQVHCLDRRTREVVWRRDLEADCGGALPDFGWAATPLVRADLVILPALGTHVGLIAFDRLSGETVWQTPGLGVSHSTPVVLSLLGQDHLLFLSTETVGQGADRRAPMAVHAFDPRTGAALWSVAIQLTSVPVPPPVRVDEERFFVTGGYGGGSTMMRIRRKGADFALEECFHVAKGAQLHPPVVHDGHVYLLANENSNESRRRRHLGGLTCFDFAGRELWSTGDDPYMGRGHVMGLGDYLLVQDGQSGILRLCLATPLGYTPLATANVFAAPPKSRHRTWAPMARAGGTLVVRGRTELRCVELGGRSAVQRENGTAR
jgi:outer membrane protein assembly factor BamB